MSLFPNNWTEQKPWVCPKCCEVIYVGNVVNTKDWCMCTQCEIKETSERLAHENTKYLTNHKMIITRPINKPHYKYNWKTGKPEIKQ